ncbi:hypothetical protein L2E82_51288 [Cichorium intybus]|nr:hypothetical protein L2E82_51288 [Cichorium intybus]
MIPALKPKTKKKTKVTKVNPKVTPKPKGKKVAPKKASLVSVLVSHVQGNKLSPYGTGKLAASCGALELVRDKNVNEEDDRPSTVAPGIKGYKEPNTWCDKIEGTVEEDKSAEETECILKNNGCGGKECEAGFVRVSSSQRENKYHGRMECDRNTNELVEEMVVGGSSCEGNENGGCDEDVYVISAENEYKKQSFTVAAGVPTVDATVDDQEKHGYTQQTVERSATPAVEYPVDDPEDNGSIQQTDEFIKSMHNHVKDNKDITLLS